MAAKKGFKKKTIVEEFGTSGNFGKYREDTGGGEPIKPTQGGGRGEWARHNFKESRTSGQPRTDDGKFTYNSVNGKGISTKKSRGVTVNPLLTGGENGIKIEDVEKEFSQESGSYWNKYKDKWYRKGGEIVGTDFKVRVSAEAIWNVAKEFNDIKGEFQKEEGLFEEVKKGRPTVEEKSAKQKAQATNEETPVIGKSGGIKLKPGVTVTAPAPAPTLKPYKPKPSASVPAQPQTQTPTQAVQTANVGSIANADYTPKYSDDDYAFVRTELKNAGLSDKELADFDALSPKEKDNYIDKYFDTSNQ